MANLGCAADAMSLGSGLADWWTSIAAWPICTCGRILRDERSYGAHGDAGLPGVQFRNHWPLDMASTTRCPV